jgi:transketolase
MRNAFARAVTDVAGLNRDLVLLAGDIGNRLFDEYKRDYADRFYNCGVAEAGMTGLAAGLASSGLQPITYTITPFNTIRCLEQIRVDICYPDLPVIIVGTGAGLSYASLGSTHHSLEDICCMRMLPNMHVICPADSLEVRMAVIKSLELGRPCYIRLGKKGEPDIHKKEPPFIIGKALPIINGNDVALLSVGNMAGVAIEVEGILSQKGLSVELVSMHTIKPLDQEYLEYAYHKFKLLVVLEEHGLVGGSGSAILEWAHMNRKDARKFLLINTPDQFLTAIGNQTQARMTLKLDAESISEAILECI